MRITQNIMIANFLRNLNMISSRLDRTEQQLATGKKYSSPADGPVEVSQIVGFQSASARIAQYLKNVDDGSSQVSFIDTIVQAVNTDTGRARDLAITAANDSLNQNDRIATGQEINLILESTLSNANSRFRDRYTFAGWKSRAIPFEAVYNPKTSEIEDVIYKGDQGTIDRLVGDNDRLTVNVTGKSLFLEQTYSRRGKALPSDTPLGFEGQLTINGVHFQITADQTLKEIATMLNAQSARSYVFARIDDGALILESTKAVGKFVLSDDQNDQLLEDLGLYLHGAFNTGTVAPTLPIVDSTPAIFNAAGPVANLTYDNTNNVLNIFLGANANEGVSKAANIVITPGTYTSVADLIVEIQKQIDTAFGRDKITVSDAGGGTLRIETVATGAGVGAGDLMIGGSYFGIPDTASDSADLNLVAVVGNAPPTPAAIAGVDGNDKFMIDLGPTASKNGLDVPPATIDLRASAITTVDDLIDEIRYQIFQNDALRGAVDVWLKNGRVHFETVKKGSGVLSSDFAFSEGATGTLGTLGISDVPIKAQIAGTPIGFPFIVVAGLNDTLTLDLGPSVSVDGTDPEPVTITIAPGIYNNINTIFNELSAKIQGNMTLNGAVEVQVNGPPGFEYLVLSSVKAGSSVRGEDFNLTGPLVATLGLPAGDAVAGGGTADGQGIELEPNNIFNTLINLRDDCYGGVGIHSNLLSAQDEDGQLLGLLEGDNVTVSYNGVPHTFTILASDTMEDFATNLQEIFGTRALVQVTSDGRIRLENQETSQIMDFSIAATSPLGEPRTLFNAIFSDIPTSIPSLTSVNSKRFLDPTRYQRLGDEDLGLADTDLENLLGHVAVVGARANRLTTVTNLFDASNLNIKDLRNSIEAANYAETLTYLSQQQLILQSSLNVGANILPPTLLDFLT